MASSASMCEAYLHDLSVLASGHAVLHAGELRTTIADAAIVFRHFSWLDWVPSSTVITRRLSDLVASLAYRWFLSQLGAKLR